MQPHSELDVDETTRTSFSDSRYLRIGGVMVLAATAAACSFGPSPRVETESAPTTTAAAPSDNEKTTLEFAAKLEATVKHLYETWAAVPAIAANPPAVDLLGALGTNHTAHLGALNSHLVRNGRKEIKAGVDPTVKTQLAPSDPTTPEQLLHMVANVEDILAQTFLSLVGSGSNARLDLDFVAMAGADARHLVAVRHTQNPAFDPVTVSRYPVAKALKP